MTRILASAMVIAMALALALGILFYGGVDPDVAAPMYFCGLLGAALWGFRLLVSGSATWKHSPMHLPVLAFAAYAVIRYCTSPIEYDARVELLYVLLCVIAYFAACQFYRPSDRTVLLVVIIALVAFESGYAIWQFSAKSEKALFWFRPSGFSGRGGGSFICPNNFAAFLQLALGLLLARGLMMHRRQGSVEAFAVQRLVILYVALTALISVAVAQSRGGWAGMVGGLLMLLAWGDWRDRIPWGRIAAVGVALALLATVVWKFAPTRVLTSFTSADKRGNTALGVKDWTLNSRVHLWKATAKLVQESPIMGTGLGSWQWLSLKHKEVLMFSHPEYAHNEYLNLLSDYGAIGFLIMLWVFIAFFKQMKGVHDERVPSDERSFAIGAVVGVTAVLVHAFFDFNFHIPGISFMLAIVMGSATAIEDPEQRYARVPLARWAQYTLGAGLLVICTFLGWQFSKVALAARYTRLGNDAKYLYFHIDPDIALNLYRQAIKADARTPMAHWKTGDLRRQQAQWRLGADKKVERQQLARQAVESYATALRLNPYHTDVVIRAALADELAGDDQGALEKLQRALELEPNSALNHEKLARFCRDHDRPEEALRHYQVAQRFRNFGDHGINANIEELQELLKAPKQP